MDEKTLFSFSKGLSILPAFILLSRMKRLGNNVDLKYLQDNLTDILEKDLWVVTDVLPVELFISNNISLAMFTEAEDISQERFYNAFFNNIKMVVENPMKYLPSLENLPEYLGYGAAWCGIIDKVDVKSGFEVVVVQKKKYLSKREVEELVYLYKYYADEAMVHFPKPEEEIDKITTKFNVN